MGNWNVEKNHKVWEIVHIFIKSAIIGIEYRRKSDEVINTTNSHALYKVN